MKTITVVIYNDDQSEYTYYSALNIKKILKDENPVIKIFDTGKTNRVINHLDDIEVIRNYYCEYIDYINLNRNDVYAQAVSLLIDKCNTDILIIIKPEFFIDKNIKYFIENVTDISGNYENNNFNILIIDTKKNSNIKFNNFDELKQKVNNKFNNTGILHGTDDITSFLYNNAMLWKTEYEDIIVSLTSFKGRINDKTTQDVLLSLLNQVTKYKYKVVLVLALDEFGDTELIPAYLKKYLEKYSNFEILWTKRDTRPLKKLDPTMEKYPNLPIITLDDDDLVYSNMINTVVDAHRRDPYSVLGTSIEVTNNFIKWVACVRVWPPHCLYNFPLSDYYKYYDGILDDNFNAMRCAYKMTPVKSMPICSEKCNATDLKLATEYTTVNWGYYYKRFIINHLDEIPEELYYSIF